MASQRFAVAREQTREARKLGGTIRKLREQRGLSLKELANCSDTDKGQLSKIERGLMEPPLPRLRRIARELGTTAGELLSS